MKERDKLNLLLAQFVISSETAGVRVKNEVSLMMTTNNESQDGKTKFIVGDDFTSTRHRD